MGKRVEKRRGKPWLLGLPLAIALILAAPAPAVTSLAAQPKDDAVGDAEAAAFAVKNLEVPAPISAVQDWSLLCKELCGAGLGVASTPGGAKDAILRPKFDVAKAKCRQLCGLPRAEWGDKICSSFCQQRSRSLPGCSPCQQEVRRMQEEDVWREEMMASGVQGESAHGSGFDSAKPMPIPMHREAVAAPIAAAADAEATTAAPDWNEVCKVLCKTGDGGSLCNCDLSPFFT